MKLIIDRGSTIKRTYTFEFGADYDVLIGRWYIWIPSVSKETMSEIDRLITNSPSKVFCVTHIKHPLLLKEYNQSSILNKNYYGYTEEETFKNNLREYFAIRLQHRKYEVELYEIGKRLFK